MKIYQYLLIAICLLISACGQPITYIGMRLTKTNSVAIFYSANAVKRNYKVIGHLASHHYRLEFAKQRFINRAKSVGADAIVILNADTSDTNRINLINADVLKYE